MKKKNLTVFFSVNRLPSSVVRRVENELSKSVSLTVVVSFFPRKFIYVRKERY